ncbi:LADA_0H06282g1_1 [Lachancea dasiensis]|uniref:LADA_0H06282g1_1 n=1 Tax=Lachancea dasiensis TaxID=1072105 RepID=A0A1G4K1J6_9SACH|nr:LADA_0H06282g1_1 [Lachancea dasiensis]
MSSSSNQQPPAFWETAGALECSQDYFFHTFKSSEEVLKSLGPGSPDERGEVDDLDTPGALRPYTDGHPNDTEKPWPWPTLAIEDAKTDIDGSTLPSTGSSRSTSTSTFASTPVLFTPEEHASLLQSVSSVTTPSEPCAPNLKRYWSADDVQHHSHPCRVTCKHPARLPRARSQLKYVCPECGKVFQRPSSLATHINIHTGEKPFQCPFQGCRRHFNARSNMVRHYRLHFKNGDPNSTPPGLGDIGGAEQAATPLSALRR